MSKLVVFTTAALALGLCGCNGPKGPPRHSSAAPTPAASPGPAPSGLPGHVYFNGPKGPPDVSQQVISDIPALLEEVRAQSDDTYPGTKPLTPAQRNGLLAAVRDTGANELKDRSKDSHLLLTPVQAQGYCNAYSFLIDCAYNYSAVCMGTTMPTAPPNTDHCSN